jgi:hypothetical protein
VKVLLLLLLLLDGALRPNAAQPLPLRSLSSPSCVLVPVLVLVPVPVPVPVLVLVLVGSEQVCQCVDCTVVPSWCPGASVQ